MLIINNHDYDDGHDVCHVGDQLSQSGRPGRAKHCFQLHQPDNWVDHHDYHVHDDNADGHCDDGLQ